MIPLEPDEAAEPEDADRPDRPLVGGRYRIDGDTPLGSGGMGEVWRATDTLLGRTVALKHVQIGGLSQQSVEQVRERTLREGRIAARLHHPNVVTIFDVIVAEDRLWLVLEYVPSRSADKVLAAEGPLPPPRAAHIGAQIAEALATAHAAGIHHRDIKPGNVLVDATGRAKLTDFGISHAVNDLRLTASGMITGTPAFMAPEIARGDDYSNASDIYGLGATLYTLVEGHPPFGIGDPHNPLRLMRQIASGQAPPPTLAGPLTGVLTRMIDPDPGGRPDAATARDVLNEIAKGSTAAPPGPTPTLVETRRPGLRRLTRRTVLAAIALGVAALAAATSVLLPHLRQSTPEPPASAAHNYLPDPRYANPCALRDGADYTGFGSTKAYATGAFLNECGVGIVLTGGGAAEVNFFLFSPRTLWGATEQRGDLTIVRPEPSNTQCDRFVVLPDRTYIDTRATLTGGTVKPCQLADLGTDAVLRILSSTGAVPRYDSLGEATSIYRQHACQLLNNADLGALPGLDLTKTYPAFGDWGCTWGNDPNDPHFGPPAVEIVFLYTAALIAPQNGALENIAGRNVFIQIQTGDNDQTECTAQVVHRHRDGSIPRDEIIDVAVYAAVPAEEQCQMARELAAKVIARLPPP